MVAVCILLVATSFACAGDSDTGASAPEPAAEVAQAADEAVEKADAKAEWHAVGKGQWAEGIDEEKSVLAGDVGERIVAVVDASGGEVYNAVYSIQQKVNIVSMQERVLWARKGLTEV